jgi:hypothetical protein
MSRALCPILALAALLATACSGNGQVASPDAGTKPDAGPTYGRTTPLDGLTVPALRFTVFGDCRPVNPVEDPSTILSVYPTAVATRMFQAMAGQNPQFGVFTGDVVYVDSKNSTASASPQIDQFLQARSAFDRPIAPALGNHDVYYGVRDIWSGKFVGTLGGDPSQGAPLPAYYSFTVHSGAGDALFVVLDDTQWDSRQSAWAAGALAASAKYKIVVKHHPTDTTDLDATSVADIQSVITNAHTTLVLTGHEHNYAHRKANELVLGTAGAPLARSAPGNGYALVTQQDDGSLAVAVYTNDTNLPVDQWQVSP